MPFGYFDWFATARDLHEMEKRIMAKLDTFLAAQKAFNETQSAAIDAVSESIKAIGLDIDSLNEKIDKLEEGGVTPEQEALMAEIQAAGDELSTRVGTLRDAAKALDDRTPPVVPPVQPT